MQANNLHIERKMAIVGENNSVYSIVHFISYDCLLKCCLIYRIYFASWHMIQGFNFSMCFHCHWHRLYCTEINFITFFLWYTILILNLFLSTVSSRNIRLFIHCWMVNDHFFTYCDLLRFESIEHIIDLSLFLKSDL